MQRDVERVLEINAAYQRRDLESSLLLMAETVEVIQSPELPWGGHYAGHDGVRRFLTSIAQHLDARVTLERMIDAGDQVVAVGRLTGIVRATQLEFDVPLVHVWTFQEGQVTRLEAYLDNATLLTALGR